jgi:hypothetical protein
VTTLKPTNPDRVILCAVGDILPSFPHEQEQVLTNFSLFTPIMRKADIAFGQLESILSERENPAFARNPVDVPMTVKALVDAGFNILSFAGNHHMRAGAEAFVDTIEILKKNNIVPLGVGMNIAEARAPKIIDKNGVKVAFLGYSAVIPRGDLPYEASPRTPGCAPMYISTYYDPIDWQPGMPVKIVTQARKNNLDAMLEDIKIARSQADVVVMSIHWGIHNIPVLMADYQYEVGHAAIDAGVDLILGHHSHVLKPIEVYKGKVIFYCLGNCVVPRRKPVAGKSYKLPHPWSPYSPDYILEPGWEHYAYPEEFRHSMIAKCVISGKEIERVSFLPATVNQSVQLEPVNRQDPRSDAVVKYVEFLDEQNNLNTKFRRDGDEVVVLT